MKLLLLVILVAAVALVAGDEFKLVCYYTNWAQYRANRDAGFFPEDIDPHLCTHIIYSFAFLKDNGLLGTREWNDEAMYKRFNDLKKKNPKLKTQLAVGGWTHPAKLFTDAVKTKESRAKLNQQIIQILRKYNFDGFDFDWEYPANRGSPPQDKKKFTMWAQELRAAFDQEAKSTSNPRLILSAAVAAGKNTIDSAYQIGELSKALDFINLMAYDLHGAWEKKTMNQAPFLGRPGETAPGKYLNVKFAAEYWKKQIVAAGEPASKLILGLPSYGRSFTLESASNHGVLAPAIQAGTPAKATEEAGFMAYFEVCDLLKNGGKSAWDDVQKFPYAWRENQWVGYDNHKSLKAKVDWAKKEHLGGAMFWALDLDDFEGTHCGQKKYPLISFVKKILNGQSPKVDIVESTGGSGGDNGNTETGGEKNGGNAGGDENGGNGGETGTSGGGGGGGNGGGTNPSGPFTCGADGTYMRPEDCTTFHHCSHGVDHVKSCPAGLMFSSGTSGCVWPEQSDCNNP